MVTYWQSCLHFKQTKLMIHQYSYNNKYFMIGYLYINRSKYLYIACVVMLGLHTTNMLFDPTPPAFQYTLCQNQKNNGAFTALWTIHNPIMESIWWHGLTSRDYFSSPNVLKYWWCDSQWLRPVFCSHHCMPCLTPTKVLSIGLLYYAQCNLYIKALEKDKTCYGFLRCAV